MGPLFGLVFFFEKKTPREGLGESSHTCIFIDYSANDWYTWLIYMIDIHDTWLISMIDIHDISGPFMANFMFFWPNFRAEKVGRAQNHFCLKNQKRIWKIHPKCWKPRRCGLKSYAEFGSQLILGSHMRPKSSKTVSGPKDVDFAREVSTFLAKVLIWCESGEGRFQICESVVSDNVLDRWRLWGHDPVYKYIFVKSSRELWRWRQRLVALFQHGNWQKRANIS